MAPEAMKGAALEKNGRADAGAVMNGETLDIEDQALGHEIPRHCDRNISHIRANVKRFLDPKFPIEPVIAGSEATWQIPPSPPFRGVWGDYHGDCRAPFGRSHDNRISNFAFLSAISGLDLIMAALRDIKVLEFIEKYSMKRAESTISKERK